MKKTIQKKMYVTLSPICIFLLCYNTDIWAQVTIGSNTQPAKGAVLDMKENTAVNGAATATKGIIFPRVELSSLTSLPTLIECYRCGR